jgi:hypothetical protein
VEVSDEAGVAFPAEVNGPEEESCASQEDYKCNLPFTIFHQWSGGPNGKCRKEKSGDNSQEGRNDHGNTSEVKVYKYNATVNNFVKRKLSFAGRA